MSLSSENVADAFAAAAREELAKAAEVIRHCLGQITDEQIAWRPKESLNSIGNLLLHLCGNVRQWIISGVGGEPDVRDRPEEFAERGPFGKEDVLRKLDEVVEQADAVLRILPSSQLLERHRIQGFDTTGLSAIFDSVAHFKGHTQEIVLLTRMQLADDWSKNQQQEGRHRNCWLRLGVRGSGNSNRQSNSRMKTVPWIARKR